jgi:hypothetical protein
LDCFADVNAKKKVRYLIIWKLIEADTCRESKHEKILFLFRTDKLLSMKLLQRMIVP